jgi:8-oxo-dGTP pyrophosphatase MutT (NUDIX family)
MHFDDLIPRLADALTHPLPGSAAHALMEPRPRRATQGANRTKLRAAAGLVLLFPVGERPHLVLTVRHAALGRHAGQVSLPGGVVDPGETFEDAAIRETQEEIGLDPGNLRILGRLSSVDIAVSGFRLHPVVGTVPTRPALVPASREVSKILELPLAELLDPGRLVLTERRRGSLQVAAPAFRAGGEEIWGATAMALAELLVLTGWTAPRPK